MGHHPNFAELTQPQVDADAVKLATYEHGGLWLDLYGRNTKDGITVEDVALVGSRVSLAAAFGDEIMDQMGEWCEREAKRERVSRPATVEQAIAAVNRALARSFPFQPVTPP